MLDGKPVTRQWFAAASSYLYDIISKLEDKPSYFEYVTALAMYIFNFVKVDYGILEVGMGGRLDATNTVVPKISVITSISVDHSEFLGSSVSSIASEKAGIIKTGVPVVTSVTGEALDVIKLKASSLSCPFYSLESMNVQYSDENGYKKVTFEIDGKCMSAKAPLKGEFQGENLALAMVVYYLLTNDTDFNCEKTVWPARLETFKTNPEFTLDGAHNFDAISKLLQSFNATKDDCLVFGCMRDKEVDAVFGKLKNSFQNIILTSGNYHRFMQKDDFASNSCFSGFEYFPMEEVIENLSSYKRVLVTGSLHLTGDFLKELVKNDKYKNAVVEKEPYCYIFDDFPF
jgi:dihydrofolate synthase/folylpolyglutamate synthase